MSEPIKKTYTVEDHLKYISFGIKDGVKAIADQLEGINISLAEIRDKLHKTDNDALPF